MRGKVSHINTFDLQDVCVTFDLVVPVKEH